jgi:DNA-binding MarR family transcriptional regulator
MTAQPTASPSSGWQLHFVEEVAANTDMGLPLSLSRIMAWLVVCEPGEQSANEIRSALQLSAGSVSTGTTVLVRDGLVRRRTRPGDRRIYYELHPEGWERLLTTRVEMLTRVHRVADEALAAGGDNQRLLAMRDFYAGCERQIGLLLAAAAPPKPKRGKGAKRPVSGKGGR